MHGRWEKKGFIWRADSVADWWDANTHAPAPLDMQDGRIRLFVGAWKKGGAHPVSRIGYVDVAADDPRKVLAVSGEPVVDIGLPGTYSDSGVFPAHVHRLADGRVFLYTSGFQHSTHEEVDFLQFGGLAVSEDGGDTFMHYQGPVLPPTEEGLHNRAGLSIFPANEGGFHCVYSAGSGFHSIHGKNRLYYDVHYQHSPDGITFAREGRRIIKADPALDHAWGRPQLIFIGGEWVVLCSRRVLKGAFCMGCARSPDLQSWQKDDDWLATIPHGKQGEFDSDMLYYPAVCSSGGKTYLFYCGNGFGRDGLGYAELT